MIARLSYVMCDECGDPAEACDDATEARRLARGVGFVRRDGRDLCARCASPEPQENVILKHFGSVKPGTWNAR